MSKKEALSNLFANVYSYLKYHALDWLENVFLVYLMLVFIPLHWVPAATRPLYKIRKISFKDHNSKVNRFVALYTIMLIILFSFFGWSFYLWCASVIFIGLLNKSA